MKKKAILFSVVFPLLGLVVVVLFVALFMAVPNVQTWQRKAEAVRAISEISNIELALTKILADAGRSSLRDLFDPEAFQTVHAAYMAKHGANSFDASVALYSRAAYALLRNGRDALTIPPGWNDTLHTQVQPTLNAEVVRSLGTSYISELRNDPWGNPYQFYPGPWPRTMGPVLFRQTREPDLSSYLPAGPAHQVSDALTITIAGEPTVTQGLPASARMDVYVWSFGRNEVSDQPTYDPTHVYAAPARKHYRKDATEEYLGGGDDINSWDWEQTFMTFYN